MAKKKKKKQPEPCSMSKIKPSEYLATGFLEVLCCIRGPLQPSTKIRNDVSSHCIFYTSIWTTLNQNLIIVDQTISKQKHLINLLLILGWQWSHLTNNSKRKQSAKKTNDRLQLSVQNIKKESNPTQTEAGVQTTQIIWSYSEALPLSYVIIDTC